MSSAAAVTGALRLNRAAFPYLDKDLMDHHGPLVQNSFLQQMLPL